MRFTPDAQALFLKLKGEKRLETMTDAGSQVISGGQMFRRPTNKEWVTAAAAGKSGMLVPPKCGASGRAKILAPAN